MKIGIDARLLGLKNAGLGRYTSELVNNLIKIDKKNDYVIFLRRDNWKEIKICNPRFKKILADFAPYSLSEQLFFPWLLYRENCDLVHFTSVNAPIFYFKKCVVTVHDLIKHYFRGPETTTRWAGFYWLKYAGYLIVSWWLIKLCKKIICPSKDTQGEIERVYSFAKDKIMVTYEAASEVFLRSKEISSPMAKNFLQEKGVEKPFVIYVGNAYPHKNLERLVKAIKLINQKGFSLQLAIVCSRGVFYERLKNLIEKESVVEKVKMLGFVKDEDLLILYSEARAYVFPSLMEGFGIPPLDAMACGLPVVSSKASCLPEIYGEAAYYFNPENIEKMAEAIIKVLIDEKLRKQLIKDGHERIKLYSWEKMAKETLKIYEEV